MAAGPGECGLSIDNLKTTINGHGGVQRTSRYEVELTSIGNVVPISPGFFRDVSPLITGVSVPGMLINPVEYTMWDKPIQLPTGSQSDEFGMEFLATNDGHLRYTFKTWMDKIIDVDSQLIEYYKNYICNMKVYVLNDAQNRNYEIQLDGVYPLSFTGYTFDAKSDDAMTFSVKFAYHKLREKALDPGVGRAERMENLDRVAASMYNPLENLPNGYLVNQFEPDPTGLYAKVLDKLDIEVIGINNPASDFLPEINIAGAAIPESNIPIGAIDAYGVPQLDAEAPIPVSYDDPVTPFAFTDAPLTQPLEISSLNQNNNIDSQYQIGNDDPSTKAASSIEILSRVSSDSGIVEAYSDSKGVPEPESN